MFKINLSDTYYFPVTVDVAVDGGKFDKVKFDAQFKRLPRSEVKPILARLGRTDLDGEKIENPITDDELLNMVFVGWKGIADETGEPLAYSETSREAVLNIHGVAAAIVRSWFDSIAGSKTKN